MKLIVCDKCKDIIPLSFEKKVCSCQRIAGKYDKDGLSGIIWYQSKGLRKWMGALRGCRVVAVDTHLLRGHRKQSVDYVFDWKNSGLTVYHNGKLIKKTPEDYGEKNALVFLGTALQCIPSKYKAKKELKSFINKAKKEFNMPPKSKAQAKFMRGVASGSIKKKGLSRKEAKEFVSGYPTKGLPKKKK